MYPAQDGVIDTLLLVVLGLGEAHALVLRVTKLIGEDNHQVLAREIRILKKYDYTRERI